MLDQRGFLGAGNVKVNQRQIDVAYALVLAQQPAVNFDLRPMQRALVARHVVQVAPVGFDLFQLVARWVVTVGTATHAQCFVVAFKRDL